MILITKDTSNNATQGYGQVHHIALRVKDKDGLDKWIEKFDKEDLRHSGYIDRFYFKSLYVRLGYILFEIATDGPGFMQDEPYETLGEKLALPPFLEPKREYIESVVKPFNTKRNKNEKE